jgi:metacaspase-1
MLKYLFVLLIYSFQTLGTNKYAILIGIGAYPTEVSATTLNGDNDVDLMLSTLKGLGFQQQNIIALKNIDATKSNIVKTFNLLTTILQKGDILVVHYSGHGRQVIDDDIDTQKGIKEEADGYDEAILCYDGQFLIDDDIHTIFTQVQKKIGKEGQMIAFFDCCYSGTITRDMNVQKNIENFEELHHLNNIEAADLFFFSSVSASGKSEQTTKGVGILTEALAKTLKLQLKTYTELFAKIQEEVSKMPNSPHRYTLLPTFEGNGSAFVFGQGVQSQDFFYEIQAISNDSTSITIDGGKFAGIFEKSEVSIYPLNSLRTKESEAIYTGNITESQNFTSKVSFNKKLKIPNLKSFWVFITKPSFEDYKLSIAVDKKDSVELGTAVKGYSLLKISTFVGGSHFSLKKEKNQIALLDNQSLQEITLNKDIDTVLTVAQQFARASILKKIESVNNPDYRISIELIPISKNNVDLRDSLSKNLYIKGNTPTFDTTMQVLLRVTNIGDKPCYFSILNISSSGSVQAILPSDENQKYDLMLPQKGSFFLSDEILEFTPPFGNETLIGFASKKPINLLPIINNTWSQTRGDDSLLNLLLNDVYSGTRSPQDIDFKKSEAGIFKYHYQIIPKTN